MLAAALRGDAVRAREINARLLPLHYKLFVEANPIPVKWAVQQMGLMEGGLRLPLTPLQPQYHDVVREAMRSADIKIASEGGLRLVEGRAK
jgi:4-hydroxy-tetrahydrodipicolinate synthase